MMHLEMLDLTSIIVALISSGAVASTLTEAHPQRPSVACVQGTRERCLFLCFRGFPINVGIPKKGCREDIPSQYRQCEFELRSFSPWLHK